MLGKRILRERNSVEKMIAMYCKAKHGTNTDLCEECSYLLEYALQRLQHCIFGEDKLVCAKCPIHCYRKEMREKIIAIMRYSGPRMIYKHPVLTLLHLFDKSRKVLVGLTK